MKLFRRILANCIFSFILCLCTCLGCRKNAVFNDADEIVGEWSLKNLTWSQNSIEISVSPEMKGYRESIDFQSNRSYIKITVFIWSDTSITETGSWSLEGRAFTLNPENGKTEEGTYELERNTLSLYMIKKMIIDESGIAKDIPVIMTYIKSESMKKEPYL